MSNLIEDKTKKTEEKPTVLKLVLKEKEKIKRLAEKFYKMKDLADCFGVSAPKVSSALSPAVSSTLNRYGIGLIKIRHNYKNGIKA